MSRAILIAAIFGVGPLLGCTRSPTEPELNLVNPGLSSLEIFRSSMIYGVFVVHGSLADSALVLGELDRLVVNVRTSRGESERLMVGPEICTSQDNRRFYCTQLSIELTAGNRVEDLISRIVELPGWLFAAFDDGRLGGIEIFAGTILEARQQALRWPGVASVELVSAETTIGPPTDTELRGIGSLQFANPVVGDQVIQVLAGDTVTIEYQQPDGTTFSDTAVVACEEDPNSIGRPPIVPTCR